MATHSFVALRACKAAGRLSCTWTLSIDVPVLIAVGTGNRFSFGFRLHERFRCRSIVGAQLAPRRTDPRGAWPPPVNQRCRTRQILALA